MWKRILAGAVLALLPALALAQSSAGSSGGGGGGGGGGTGYYAGQYNSPLASFANGQAGYLSVDQNARLILSPGGSVGVSNFPATQAVTGSVTATLNQGGAALSTSNPIFTQVTNFPASQAVTGTVSVSNFPASQAVTNAGTFAVQVSNQNTQTTAGALQPPTAAAGKILRTSTAVAANTSTTIAASNTARIAFGLQCASGAVSVDETGAALTAAGVGNGTLFMPSGTAPYFTPPIATQAALTAYTATAQSCVVTEYLR